MNEELVERVEDAGDDEDLSYVAPGAPKEHAPLRFVGEGGPEKWWAISAGVAEAGVGGAAAWKLTMRRL